VSRAPVGFVLDEEAPATVLEDDYTEEEVGVFCDGIRLYNLS
jgi:hypothetical protein